MVYNRTDRERVFMTILLPPPKPEEGELMPSEVVCPDCNLARHKHLDTCPTCRLEDTGS